MGQQSLTDTVLSVNFPQSIHPSGSSVSLFAQTPALSGFFWCALLLLASIFHHSSKGYNNKPLECGHHTSNTNQNPLPGTGQAGPFPLQWVPGKALHIMDFSSCGSTWSITGEVMIDHRESTNAPFNTETAPCGPGQVTPHKGTRVLVTQGTT